MTKTRTTTTTAPAAATPCGDLKQDLRVAQECVAQLLQQDTAAAVVAEVGVLEGANTLAALRLRDLAPYAEQLEQQTRRLPSPFLDADADADAATDSAAGAVAGAERRVAQLEHVARELEAWARELEVRVQHGRR